MVNTRRVRWTLIVGPAILLAAAPLCAQEDAKAEDTKPAPQPVATADMLSQEQSRLADKYRRLEDLIFKMADFEATSNPRRAALLKQAYKQSKDRLTFAQLNSIVKLLGDKKFKRALDGQEIARNDLQGLLQLLLTEDRSDRLKTETQRIKNTIRELKKLAKLQRSVRGRTEGADDPKRLAKDQQKVADRTGDLAKKLEQADGSSGTAGPQSKPKETPPGAQDEPPDSKEPGDDNQKKQNDKDAKDGTRKKEKTGDSAKSKPESDSKSQGNAAKDAKQGDSSDSDQKGKQGKQGKPGSESPPQGKGQGGDEPAPQDQPQSQEDNPVKKRVREAEQKMREAQQKLEEAKRTESVEKQTEAVEKLEEAIAQLEQILRQLREEEKERMLALLEGRFRKMLEMQVKVYEGTLRVDKVPLGKRGRAVVIRANKLAFDERKIAGQADRCLTLLLEEGSSVAFPEVVEQLREDMEEVSARLAQTKVSRLTQGLEEEIIGTLEEMIEALQKAQQDLDKSRPGQPGNPNAMRDPPLVDILAELKMIRSLQQRVNSRTRRYARLLDDADDPVGQAANEDLGRAIGKLGQRQARIQRITRDIVLEKNK